MSMKDVVVIAFFFALLSFNFAVFSYAADNQVICDAFKQQVAFQGIFGLHYESNDMSDLAEMGRTGTNAFIDAISKCGSSLDTPRNVAEYQCNRKCIAVNPHDASDAFKKYQKQYCNDLCNHAAGFFDGFSRGYDRGYGTCTGTSQSNTSEPKTAGTAEKNSQQ